MKTCARCGGSIADGAAFCEECGARQPRSEGPDRVGAEGATVLCGSCREEMPADAVFCPECGAPRRTRASVKDESAETPRCAACGARLDPTDAFCSECGAQVGVARGNEPSEPGAADQGTPPSEDQATPPDVAEV